MKQEPTKRDAQPLPLSNATSSVAHSSDAVMDWDWQASAEQPALGAVPPERVLRTLNHLPIIVEENPCEASCQWPEFRQAGDGQ